MNAQYFIDKFTPIPDDQWITGQLCDSQGRCCVLGHCGERRGVYEGTAESMALTSLFMGKLGFAPHEVNDDERMHFPQVTTPKTRILAALEHIKNL